MKRIAVLSVAVAAVLAAPARAAVYELDPDHTTVGFKIRHLVSKVPGTFDKFSGVVNYEAGKPETWKVEATIDAASINTRVAPRDKHLRSDAFFDVEKCPQITFKSGKVANVDLKAGTAKLEGDLTIRCTTKPVVLDLEIHGVGKDPWGNERAGFAAKTRINRQDFGVAWNKALEGGGYLLSDDVEIEIDAEAVKAAPKAERKP